MDLTKKDHAHDHAHNRQYDRAYDSEKLVCIQKHAPNARTSSMWNISGGQRTMARPTDDGQTNQKWTTDRPFKK